MMQHHPQHGVGCVVHTEKVGEEGGCPPEGDQEDVVVVRGTWAKVELVSDQVTLAVTKLLFTSLAASSLTAKEHLLNIGDVERTISTFAEFELMSTKHLL